MAISRIWIPMGLKGNILNNKALIPKSQIMR